MRSICIYVPFSAPCTRGFAFVRREMERMGIQVILKNFGAKLGVCEAERIRKSHICAYHILGSKCSQ